MDAAQGLNVPGSCFGTLSINVKNDFKKLLKNFQLERINYITFLVRSSSQAIRIRSAVAGESNVKISLEPDSHLAARMASLIAKKTLAAKNKGGSPTAYHATRKNSLFNC